MWAGWDQSFFLSHLLISNTNLDLYQHSLPNASNWCVGIVARLIHPKIVTNMHTTPYYLPMNHLNDLLLVPKISPFPLIGDEINGSSFQVIFSLTNNSWWVNHYITKWILLIVQFALTSFIFTIFFFFKIFGFFLQPKYLENEWLSE